MHAAELPATEVPGAEAAADVATKSATDMAAADMTAAKAATHVAAAATAMSRHGHTARTERHGGNCRKYHLTHLYSSPLSLTLASTASLSQRRSQQMSSACAIKQIAVAPRHSKLTMT
jgi:Spy/CpxP family protein refolding chaperone